MNQVTVSFEDKNEAGLVVNGQHKGIFKIADGYKGDGFTPCYVWYVALSNIHNQSDSIKFTGKTIKQLVNKINKHSFRLVA